MADSTITTKLLCLLGRQGIRISFFDHYGWYKGSFEPVERLQSGALCLLQAKIFHDHDRRMKIAHSIVDAAARNMVKNIAYHSYRGKISNRDIKRLSAIADSF